MYNFSSKYNCKINKSYFSQFYHQCWQTYFVVLSETLFYVLYSINSDISVLAGRVFHFSHNWSWWFFSIGLTKATLTVVCSVGVCFCLPTKEQKKCSKGPKLSKKSHFRLALHSWVLGIDNLAKWQKNMLQLKRFRGFRAINLLILNK